MGRSLADDEINSIIEHCSFKNMSRNKAVNVTDDSTVCKKGTGFYRKGNDLFLHLHCGNMILFLCIIKD